MKRFNLKIKQSQGTLYSKTGLLCQLVPSLEMTWGLGFILNMDESMSYRYDEASRVWTYQILIYYFRQFENQNCGKSSK